MITTKQKIALGALFPVAAAVWGPQVLEMVQGEETKSQVSVDGTPSVYVDGGNVHPMGGPPMGPDPGMDRAMGMDPGMGMDPAMGMGGAAPSDPMAAGGSTSSAELGNPSAVLDDVLQALRGADAFRAGPSFEASTPAFSASQMTSSMSSTGQVGFGAHPSGTPLQVFLAENPLRATLTGGATSYALMGSHQLEEGEAIPGTDAVLSSVTRGHVVVTVGDQEVGLDLPPLRADASRARARTRSDGAGTPDTDPGSVPVDPTNSDQPTADAGSF